MVLSHRNAFYDTIFRLVEIIIITFIQQISHLRTGNRLWHFQCLNILLNLQWLIPAEMKLQKQARPHLPTMQNVDTSLKKSNKSGIEIRNKSRTTWQGYKQYCDKTPKMLPLVWSMLVFVPKRWFKRNVSIQHTRRVSAELTHLYYSTTFSICNKVWDTEGQKSWTLPRFRYIQFANLTSAKHLLLFHTCSAKEESSLPRFVLFLKQITVFFLHSFCGDA